MMTPGSLWHQALKRRNLATFRNLAQQKLQQSPAQQACAQGPKAEFIKPTGFPLLVQGVRTNTKDPDAHVLFFDTESLIGKFGFCADSKDLCPVYVCVCGCVCVCVDSKDLCPVCAYRQ